MDSRKFELRPISRLKQNPYNARTHTDKQIGQIADSITAFGFINPALVDADGVILAGHGRVLAAERLGMTEVPTLLIDDLSDEQKRAYVIADNRLAELAGWDEDILRIEFQHLLDSEIEFEITDVGFETAEIDILLRDHTGPCEPDPADSVLPAVPERVITNLGELWLIGPHRLLCADALRSESYERLLGSDQARVMFTDPPYNLRVADVSGRGSVKHREFIMASGEMTDAQYTRFLSAACRNMAEASVDGAIHFICIDWRHAGGLLRAGQTAYSELLNICVWAKTAGGMGSLYRSQHELICVYKNGTAPHVNNVLLGRFGRNRSNIWSYPGLNSFQAGRAETLALHPTIKPVALVADALLDCSTRGDIVLDPFVGSGTSIIAAQRTGRRCYAMELDPAYVDVALRRVREVIGIEPTCAATGERFSDRQTSVQEGFTRKERGG